jgi:hypothetical protein
MAQVSQENAENYETFRDYLSSALVERLSKPQTKSRRRTKPETISNAEEKQSENDAEELAEFVDYIASETWESVPAELKTLNHYTWADSPSVQGKYTLPLTGASIPSILPSLDPTITDTLTTYGAINENTQGINELLAPVLSQYISTTSAPPPPPRTTRPQACEICGREWIKLTYHHLIPRMVHAKVVKRGWHREEELQNVAWLCRPCHSKVHAFAGHEDLARQFYTVELLLEQDEIRSFAGWIGGLRWKSGKSHF